MSASPTLDALRSRIRTLERPQARNGRSHAFGSAEIDGHLPEAGLPLAALHEVSGGGHDAIHAAAAALFVAGICARLGVAAGAASSGPVLWCTARTDLFAPGLACAGLHPDRVIHAVADDDRSVLLVMEEALRHPGLSAVVGEVSLLGMTASRRLVLAAEKSGVMALVLRRRRPGKPDDAGLTAAYSRWCVTPMPSAPLPSLHQIPGLGRARWQVELTRCRGAAARTWMMEACDAQGRLALFAELAHRPAASRHVA